MAIKGNRLDRLIDIQRKTVTQNEFGEEIETWANLKGRVASSFSSIRGEERFSAQQFIASEQAEFWIRFDPALETLNPRDRVIYPSGDTSAHAIWDIMEAPEVGRRDAIKIRAARRPEQ